MMLSVKHLMAGMGQSLLHPDHLDDPLISPMDSDEDSVELETSLPAESSGQHKYGTFNSNFNMESSGYSINNTDMDGIVAAINPPELRVTASESATTATEPYADDDSEDEIVPVVEELQYGRPTGKLNRFSSLYSAKYDETDGYASSTEWREDVGIEEEGTRRRSFSSLHMPPKGFNEKSRYVFLPNERITVKVVDCGRHSSGSAHILNPNLYYIEVSHGPSSWTIQRRFSHFLSLHEEMLLFKAQLHIPIGKKSHIERRKTYKEHKDKKDLSHFPRTPDALVRAQHMPKRMVQLERYLQTLVANPVYRNHPKTLEFLEVSHLSFVEELGPKGKEGWVYKKSGGHKVPVGVCPCCNCTDLSISAHYSKRWLITKDSFVCYVRPFDGHLRAVLLMDRDFKVECGREETGLSHGILISNQLRDLLVKGNSILHAREWMVELMQMAQSCEYTSDHAHQSFAPERKESYAQWFADGATYFEVLADALEEAQQEIFITDWWLNPEIFLKRPAVEGEKWRVDSILKRKAEEGVNIFILLYKEVEVALGLGSKNCKHMLKALHSNIKVLRHPDHPPGGTILWAHHEKLVAIDQKVAFLGGLDICFGRWDDHKHRLVDVGSATLKRPHVSPKKQVASADTLSDFDSGVDSTSVPDGAMTSSLHGSPHKEDQNLIIPRKEEVMTSVDKHLDTLGVQGTPKLWLGKDYCNFIAQDVVNPHLAFDDSVDRMIMPRMPWHDIGAVVYGKAAADVSRHFIQRWNFTKKEKYTGRAHYPLLLPKSTSKIEVSDYIKRTTVGCKCQILRSASTWSVGINQTEDSIQQAYLRVIRESKHYLYIENQFFITIADDNEVGNQIAEALFERIYRAHRHKETFRVYVMLPLLPAFQGEVGGDGGNAIHAILHWEYKSICQGENSLLQRLKTEAGIMDPRKYITFYGLRNHDELCGKIVTELIYIHSKMLIADDNTVIIGSANINDRSMMGKRDSELAVLVQDTELVASRMNGEKYMAGKFAGGLREWLFKEHLGVLQGQGDIDVKDPVCDDFYKGIWMKIASDNTSIYEQVFKCFPTDSARTFAALTEFKKSPGLCKTDPDAARKELKDVKGFLVWIPLQFLSGENLQPKVTTQEGIAPSKLWT